MTPSKEIGLIASFESLGILGGPDSVWVELGRVARHRLGRVRAGLKNLGPGMAIARLAYKLIRNRACTLVIAVVRVILCDCARLPTCLYAHF